MQKTNRLKSARSKKPKGVIKLINILLVISLTMLILGLLNGFFYYIHYKTGRPEQLYNSPYSGTEYVPESPPGDPNRKDAAILSLKIIGISLSSSAICFFIKRAYKTKN